MTIDCIRKRTELLEHLWNRHHDTRICSILLKQLNSDITYFLGEKLNDELENRITALEKEIYDVNN